MPRAAPTHRPASLRAKTHGADRQKRRALPTWSGEWLRIRERVLLRDAYACAACGAFGNHVDHIDGNSHNNDIGNLQTLCIGCHGRKTRREQNGG